MRSSRPDSATGTAATMDIMVSALADGRRRALLRYLADTPGQTATIDECIGYLLDEAELADDHSSRKRVAIALHHVHIPMLDDAGMLEYDAHSRELRYTGTDRLESFIDHVLGDRAVQNRAF